MAAYTTEAAIHSSISLRPDLTQEVLSNIADCLSQNSGNPLFDVLWAGFLLSSIASLILFIWRIIRFRFPCITISELKSEEDRLNEIWNVGNVGNSFHGEEREYLWERLLSIRKKASIIRRLNLEFELRCTGTLYWIQQLPIFRARLGIKIIEWHRDAEHLRLTIQAIIEREAQYRCDHELSYQVSLHSSRSQSPQNTCDNGRLSQHGALPRAPLPAAFPLPADLRKRSAPSSGSESDFDSDTAVRSTPASNSEDSHQDCVLAPAEALRLDIFSWITRFIRLRRPEDRVTIPDQV
ncbi:hypothetical protein VNI00_013350 [Paramarasmius palmivorus]|uniref:Uncharacterized protein n=1 Tax=Paramarasmius palmivorus TaxID=297713 RepID=A0AAW0C137_9AGAR